jgi:predicted nucleic acid-binding protein
MRVALDTNRLTDLLRGDSKLVDQLSYCDEVWIPLITLGEIKAGFYGGTHHDRNEQLLQRLLAKSTVDVLLPTRGTVEHYARVLVQLERAGTPIPDNDMWIAAMALENDLCLITRDRHFDCIPQLLRG